MPEMRDFIITQTREVKVTVNTHIDALQIAEAAFTNGQYNTEPAVIDGPEGVWGSTRSRVRETALHCTEERIGH